MLIISFPTTTAKHAFLVMKIQRTRVYNKMEDDIRDINKKKTSSYKQINIYV